MVRRPGIIAPEIAERFGAPLSTVQRQWKVHPQWPAPIGKRGRWAEYDAAAVEEAVRRLFRRAPLAEQGDPEDELTVADIAAYTGLSESTVRSDISRGRLPRHDDERDGVKLWKRKTIDAAMTGRRRYQRNAADDQ
ncbi:sigma factor-like helix-turn-helix DNA-binding protein [Actinoallomurus iriomotensis]|uniref:RNA polymerase sigma factor 70 region 4 type 2 domain-containing protein n=1 Tax=Actinoallomurus iriomotensis TaxID=478107 RepID=A0A9W6RXA8_9ACTN|nr:sigma factor-like helix-turn-helix DNA-binding protein [Actinoallomurus iriomotensis]GLY81812.1 hypothetical protein Airi01_100790 [Actinoallomurus iriomotensis]